MEIFHDNPKCACITISSLVLLLISIVILIYSADTVEPIEYGIKYNTLSKKIDET